MSKKKLSRDDILKAKTIKIDEFEIPEWGGIVYIRSMSGTERDEYETGIARDAREKKRTNARARLAAIVCCDESGNRLFTEEDIEALGAHNCGALEMIYTRAMRLNALTAQDIEELQKN